jgi:hypothetical protein
VDEFTHDVYNYEFWRPGMVLKVTHVRRKMEKQAIPAVS